MLLCLTAGSVLIEPEWWCRDDSMWRQHASLLWKPPASYGGHGTDFYPRFSTLSWTKTTLKW